MLGIAQTQSSYKLITHYPYQWIKRRSPLQSVSSPQSSHTTTCPHQSFPARNDIRIAQACSKHWREKTKTPSAADSEAAPDARVEKKRSSLKKKELGVFTRGGNSQKSSDCNTQKAADDTPSVPSSSPASSGNVTSV